MSGRLKESVLDRSRQVALQIHEILRKRILSLELVPGTVLSRASLQLEFGVSQTPVRDALMRLQEEGLIEVYPQYATVVARIDIANARQAQFMRLSIELEAVRRLTLESPVETADALLNVLARQERVTSPQTYDLFDSLDRDFHRTVYERAEIMELWFTVRRQSVHIDRLRRLNLPMPGKMQTVVEDHHDIVDSIRAGDPLAATTALRKHLSGTLSIIGLISQQFPDYIKR
ncbi:GntR family transcriptional regulator [Mesorhizobium sp. M0118]|uniref:GntR family transcriptional regulator n=1 Tax=Mesorhizobium sp. M0118 TaxID=2956884 RepID=UPI00333BC289